MHMHMQDAANNNDRHTHQIGGAIAHLEAIFVTLSIGRGSEDPYHSALSLHTKDCDYTQRGKRDVMTSVLKFPLCEREHEREESSFVLPAVPGSNQAASQLRIPT